MVNLREDDKAASPIGHNINMEFDGASFKFDLENVTDISGAYFKICAGRGNSDTSGKYNMIFPTAGNGGAMGSAPGYIQSEVDSPDMDMLGFIAQFYDDGQYKVLFNYFYAWNVLGIDPMSIYDMSSGAPMLKPMADPRFDDVGNLQWIALAMTVDGIGDGINDFLDDTIFFASFAMSITDPDTALPATMGGGMLGSDDDEDGYSFYTGINMPFFLEGSRCGLEYNYGSKYWRSFTYGEDTLIGSKLAARGNAYEAYWTQEILNKNFTAQIRYTYIDYEHSGSDGFFGASGDPDAPLSVENSQDLRIYLRYRY